MAAERLLKRLRRLGRTGSGAAPAMDINELTLSVLDDLSKLYNTRRGSVLIDGQYGLPDFSNLRSNLSPPECDAMIAAIRETTLRFEPRLRSVKVVFQPPTEEFGVLRFTVSANLAVRQQEVPLRFDVLLQGNGAVLLQLQE